MGGQHRFQNSDTRDEKRGGAASRKAENQYIAVTVREIHLLCFCPLFSAS